MNAVRSATDAMGLITVATIHQPSKTIFEGFDDVLLLTKGGRMTYMGENGRPLLDHFVNLTNESPPEQCNPSDFCLATLSKMEPSNAKSAFEKSDLNSDLLKSIDSEVDKTSSALPSIDCTRPNNALGELLLLTKRHMIVQWRNPSYCFMRMASSIIMSLFLGILFFGDKTELSGAVFSIGAIFFLVFVLVIPMQATVIPLVEDRAVRFQCKRFLWLEKSMLFLHFLLFNSFPLCCA